MKNISVLVLLALLFGLAAGAAVRATGDAAFLQWLGFSEAQIRSLAGVHPSLLSIASVIEPFGGLWLNTLQMTVVPLVVSLLITGVASVTDAGKAGGLVLRAVILFTVLIFFSATFAVLATNGWLQAWPLDRAAADAFVAGIGDQGVVIREPPTFASWLQGLAPRNPVAAAASDNILALVVFSIFFAFAVTRLSTELRDPIVTFFRAVSEAMIVIVHWVLLAGPIGVFALALGVGLHAGFGAAGVLAQYVVIVTGVLAGSTVLAWIIGVVWGGRSIGQFTAASAPVWAIAASTQSSLASLPAMLDAALRGLKIPARVADVVLPLAVAIFRFTSPVGNLAVCLFVAHLYGLEPSVIQTIGAVFVAYAVSIAAVGLPGQVSFIASIAPIAIALGLPTEVLGILIAVEVIPDIFRTLGNVTGDLAATSILSRGEKREDEPLHD